MKNKEDIKNIIFKTIDEVNESLADHKKISKAMGQVLFSPEEGLDSLEFAVFIVALEQKIRKELGLSITLTEDLMTEREQGPLKTVGSLVDHLFCLLEK